MRINTTWGSIGLIAASLWGCGGRLPVSAPAPGALLDQSTVVSLSKDEFAALLKQSSAGQQLLALAGAPACGIDFHYYQYQTVGAKGEATTASGVMMTPTGAGACSGARPLLVYTHGTAATKAYNLARIDDPDNEAWEESAMVAAFFAAQGDIVVASNYAGYDSSPLPYHPYLNADQQSKDVIDALSAARRALAEGVAAGVSDSGKLFITGNSEGGHVAMATHRAMEAGGMTVTASAPMSGPYATLAFGDAVIAQGNVGFSGTVYYPLLINSYQQAYGNVYQSPTDVYSANYASGIATLLPGAYTFTTIFSAGKLPETAVFDSTTPGMGNEPGTGIPALDAAMRAPDAAVNPIGALGFGDPYLIGNRFRIAYAMDAWANPDGAVPTPTTYLPPATMPASGLRQDIRKNDLRGWTPVAPTLLCGGMNDPDVFYNVNTLTMKALWTGLVNAGRVRVVDVDPTSNGSPDRAGQVAATIGAIAAGVVAAEAGSGASAAKIAGDVQNAIVSNDAFSQFLSASGAPNSPQGAMLTGMAGVASQAVSGDLAQGVTSPTQLAQDVGSAILVSYHFPLVESACLVAAQSWFRQF